MKEDGFSNDHRKDGKIHGVAHPLVGSLSYKKLRSIDGGRRAFSDEGESPGAPEVEPYSQQQRNQTKQPDGRNLQGCPRLPKEQPGDKSRNGPRDENGED